MKKVLVFGVFDELHEGHRKFLEQARRFGDELVAVLAQDAVVEKLKGHKPHADFAERSRALLSSGAVDRVAPGDTKLGTWQSAKNERPDTIAIGYDQGALEADLRLHLNEFDPVPEIIKLKPHEPEKYHTSILLKLFTRRKSISRRGSVRRKSG